MGMTCQMPEHNGGLHKAEGVPAGVNAGHPSCADGCLKNDAGQRSGKAMLTEEGRMECPETGRLSLFGRQRRPHRQDELLDPGSASQLGSEGTRRLEPCTMKCSIGEARADSARTANKAKVTRFASIARNDLRDEVASLRRASHRRTIYMRPC